MTERYLHVDGARVRFDINQLIEDHPELADDADLRADMIEGETDRDTFLTKAYLAYRTRVERAEGTGNIMSDLAARKARETAAAERIKAIMLSVVEAGDTGKVTLPVATLSVTNGRKRVVVDDVNELPQGAYTTVRKPAPAKDIEAMIVALPAGETLPGAHLEIGPDYLTVRPK